MLCRFLVSTLPWYFLTLINKQYIWVRHGIMFLSRIYYFASKYKTTSTIAEHRCRYQYHQLYLVWYFHSSKYYFSWKVWINLGASVISMNNHCHLYLVTLLDPLLKNYAQGWMKVIINSKSILIRLCWPSSKNCAFVSSLQVNISTDLMKNMLINFNQYSALLISYHVTFKSYNESSECELIDSILLNSEHSRTRTHARRLHWTPGVLDLWFRDVRSGLVAGEWWRRFYDFNTYL